MEKRAMTWIAITGIVIGSLLSLLLVTWIAWPTGFAIMSPEEVAPVVVPSVDIVSDAPEVNFIGVNTVPSYFGEIESIFSNIVVIFDEEMNPETINDDTFYIRGSNGDILEGEITSDDTKKVWTFDPKYRLKSNALYYIIITTGVKGISGNTLVENFIWSFTTGHYSSGPSSVGSSSPATTTTTPTTTTPVLTMITLTPTSKILNLTTTQQLNATSLDQNNDSMVATITYTSSNDSIATVNSTGFVTAIATGIVNITTTNGNISNVSQIFVVSSVTDCSAVSVDLGTAANFAILTYSGITNVHTSVITGDIGSSPITAAAMDNVFCSEITGTIYGVDAAYTGSGDITCFASGTAGAGENKTYVDTAYAAIGTAYTTAAGLADCVTALGAGDISGMTLASGTYKWTTGLGINTDVTLVGNATDVWVFEIAGGLTLANGIEVKLAGGALAKNVYWVVAEGATLGTTSTMNGNILNAGTLGVTNPIALNTGATLNGRALSQKAVTLQENWVTKPTD